MNYTVSDNGVIRSGTAEDILAAIRAKDNGNEEIDAMTVDEYAQALIDNADYFLNRAVKDAVEQQRFGTKFDKALNLLNAMPASGARIIVAQSD